MRPKTPTYDGTETLEPHHRQARLRTSGEQAALDALAWERYGAFRFDPALIARATEGGMPA